MFNKNNFEVAKLLSVDDDVPTSHRVLRITPEGTQATDGHLLVKVSAPKTQQPMLFPPMTGIEAAEWFTPFCIDRETALRIAKSIPTKGEPETRMVAVDTNTEVNGDAIMAWNELLRESIVRSKKIEHEYPQLDRVIPEKDRAKITVCVNPYLLAALASAFERFAKTQGALQVVIRLYGPDKGIRFDAEGDGQEITAVLMPMRSVESETE